MKRTAKERTRQQVLRKRRRDLDNDEDAVAALERGTARLRLDVQNIKLEKGITKGNELLITERSALAPARCPMKVPINLPIEVLLQHPPGILPGAGRNTALALADVPQKPQPELDPVIVAGWTHPGPYQTMAANRAPEGEMYEDEDGVLCFMTPGAWAAAQKHQERSLTSSAQRSGMLASADKDVMMMECEL